MPRLCGRAQRTTLRVQKLAMEESIAKAFVEKAARKDLFRGDGGSLVGQAEIALANGKTVYVGNPTAVLTARPPLVVAMAAYCSRVWKRCLN